jgi:hypothetical protein
MWPQSLHKDTEDTKDLHEELDLRIQGTQVEMEMTRTLVETTQHKVKTQPAEIQDDFCFVFGS